MKSHTKTYYNDLALRLIQKLFGLEYLHYGYFEPNETLDLQTLKVAQHRYTEKILSVFPSDVKKILDVGCGAGGNAKAMVDKGYVVTCIDPDPFLLSRTLEKTQGKVKTQQGLYENVLNLNDSNFDLILMSESCQYISPTDGWKLHSKYLRTGGYVLAVDFFKLKPIDKPYLSKSGHMLEDFLNQAKKAGFQLVNKIDITKQTAPTMDLYQDIISNKIFAVAEALFEFIERKLPIIYKALSFLFKKKVLFLKEKYSHQDSITFSEYKGYYMLLFKKN